MHKAIIAALLSALLFGISTPLAKVLVTELPPVALAGLLYLGAGIGLLSWRGWRRRRTNLPQSREAALERTDWGWLLGAILAGGVAAPILLLYGLTQMTGSAAALLLNLEGVFTALLAWFLFHENVDRRIAFGFALIALAGVLLSWEGTSVGGFPLGALAVVLACLGWAVDNNLTQHISGRDPVQIAGIKGLVAGAINLVLTTITGWGHPSAWSVAAALVLGLLGYGISLSLFVWALRHLGTARTGAYFSVAPFFGALAAMAILAERPGITFWLAASMMALGVWLHISERHAHLHRHERLVHTHTHPHRHDEHHRHAHDANWDGTEPHTHRHEHTPLVHAHPHYPDLHHRHRH